MITEKRGKEEIANIKRNTKNETEIKIPNRRQKARKMNKKYINKANEKKINKQQRQEVMKGRRWCGRENEKEMK